MLYLLIICLLLLTAYALCRLFLLRKSLTRTAAQLQEISKNLEENQIVKLPAPCRELEELLEAINENLAAIRAQHLTYQQEEQKLREQIENISHDLRTPLTAILGYLKMLDAKKLSQEEQEYLQIAVKKSHSLQTLISQFYELSKVTDQNFSLKLVPVDGNRILREICLEHYGLFQERNLKFHMELPEAALILLGDQDSLERIFSNLLQNGIRYAQSELSVKLHQDPSGKKAIFLFQNDLPFTEELPDPARLFDRFYVQEKSRSQGGTGLGLTISQSLTEHMNGRIHAEYTKKDGINFLSILLEFPYSE